MPHSPPCLPLRLVAPSPCRPAPACSPTLSCSLRRDLGRASRAEAQQWGRESGLPGGLQGRAQLSEPRKGWQGRLRACPAWSSTGLLVLLLEALRCVPGAAAPGAGAVTLLRGPVGSAEPGGASGQCSGPLLMEPEPFLPASWVCAYVCWGRGRGFVQ